MAIRELPRLLSVVRQAVRGESGAGRHTILYGDADCVCHSLMWRDNVL